MGDVVELIERGFEQLVGRASGPLHIRLFMMPTVVTILAIRAGLRDARQGEAVFLWTLFTSRMERRAILRSAVKDIGRVFLVAILLDTVYQLFVLRELHIVQVLIVAFACAIVPYVLLRGPVARLARFLRKRTADHTGVGAERLQTHPPASPKGEHQ